MRSWRHYYAVLLLCSLYATSSSAPRHYQRIVWNAAIQNFVVGPLSLLSGTFYSIESLHAGFQAVSHANPFFYVISGFRYGFLGTTDSPIWVGALGLLALNVLLAWANYAALARGWKIKS